MAGQTFCGGFQEEWGHFPTRGNSAVFPSNPAPTAFCLLLRFLPSFCRVLLGLVSKSGPVFLFLTNGEPADCQLGGDASLPMVGVAEAESPPAGRFGLCAAAHRASGRCSRWQASSLLVFVADFCSCAVAIPVPSQLGMVRARHTWNGSRRHRWRWLPRETAERERAGWKASQATGNGTTGHLGTASGDVN